MIIPKNSNYLARRSRVVTDQFSVVMSAVTRIIKNVCEGKKNMTVVVSVVL